MLIKYCKIQNFFFNDILKPENNSKLFKILEESRLQKKIDVVQRKIERQDCTEEEMKFFLLFLSWVSYREYLFNKSKNQEKFGFVLRDDIKKKIKSYYKNAKINFDIIDEIIIAYFVKIKKVEINISEQNLINAIIFLGKNHSKKQLLFFYLYAIQKENKKNLLDFITISKSKKINKYIENNIKYLCIKNKEKVEYHLLKKTFDSISKGLSGSFKKVLLRKMFRNIDKQSNKDYIFNIDTLFFYHPGKFDKQRQEKLFKMDTLFSEYINKIKNSDIKHSFYCEDLGGEIFNHEAKIYNSEKAIPLISSKSIKSAVISEALKRKDIHLYLNNNLFFKLFRKKKKEKLIQRIYESLNDRTMMFLNESQISLVVLYFYKYMIGDKIGFLGILPYFEVFLREVIIKENYIDVLKIDGERLSSRALSTLIRDDKVIEKFKNMLGHDMFEKFNFLFDVSEMNLKNNYSHGLFKDIDEMESIADYLFVYSVELFLKDSF